MQLWSSHTVLSGVLDSKLVWVFEEEVLALLKDNNSDDSWVAWANKDIKMKKRAMLSWNLIRLLTICSNKTDKGVCQVALSMLPW